MGEQGKRDRAICLLLRESKREKKSGKRLQNEKIRMRRNRVKVEVGKEKTGNVYGDELWSGGGMPLRNEIRQDEGTISTRTARRENLREEGLRMI